jgi:ATP-dependent Clp protease ATP-binding subunit ClpA
LSFALRKRPERSGIPGLGTEHPLLGVLAQPQAPGVSVLTELGVTLDRGRAALGQVVGEGGLGESDADALRTLGIDLDEVRRRVDASFGPGALDDPWLGLNVSRQRPRRQRRWRRRRCEQADVTGHLPVMPRAKRAFERARREALALGDQYIGVEHVLLGLLDPKSNMAVELLRRLDTDPDVIRVRVLADLGKAA